MTVISNDGLSADIAPLGAELVALRDHAGRDFLWNGDPAWWKGRAPLLFPIVGKLPDNQALIDGVTYPMPQHGIARTRVFTLRDATPATCRYTLSANDETRLHYPFDFELAVTYALQGPALSVTAEVHNRDTRPMPVSFGFHPALRWPLPGGGARDGHALTFEKPEPAPIRQLAAGLLTAERLPTPVEGRTLALHDALFAGDALIFDQLRSRSVTYAGPTGPSVRFDFPGMPHLGVWSKPGAGFVCVEPWHGYAAPQGFQGELARKEGILAVAPGSAATFAMTVTIASSDAVGG